MLFLPTFLLCSAHLAKKECAVPTFSRDPMLKVSPMSKHKDRRRIVPGQDEERDRWELQELWGKQHSSPCRTLISSGEAGRQPMSLVHAFTVNVAKPNVGSRSPQDPIVSSFCPVGISSSQHSSLPLTCSGFEYERGASEMLGCISHRSLLYCQGLSVWGIVPALTTTGEAGALGDHCNVGLVDRACVAGHRNRILSPTPAVH